jgi:hypothetical protein
MTIGVRFTELLYLYMGEIMDGSISTDTCFDGRMEGWIIEKLLLVRPSYRPKIFRATGSNESHCVGAPVSMDDCALRLRGWSSQSGSAGVTVTAGRATFG